MRALARLVVLNDPARAERVDVDPVDLPREPEIARRAAGRAGAREPRARSRRRPRACAGRTAPPEAASSRRKPSRSERIVCRSSASCSSVRSSLTPDSRASSRQRCAECDRGLEVLGRHALGVQLARKRCVEAIQRRVQHLTAQHRIRLGVDLLRVDHALDEPRGRAVREALELRRREDRLRRERPESGAAPQRVVPRSKRRARDRADETSRSRPRAHRRLRRRPLRDGRERADALARSAPTRAATSEPTAAVAGSRAARPPGRTALGRPPRTGSAHAEHPRRRPPRARARAVVTRACTSCRRDSGRVRRSPVARAVRRARCGARRSGAATAVARRGNAPSSRPSTNTTSKARVRARSWSSTATLPRRRALRQQSVVRSSAASTSSVVTASRPSDASAPSSSSVRSAARYARASIRASSVVGGDSRPHAFRIIARPVPRGSETGSSIALKLDERRHRRAAELLGLLLDPRRIRDRAASQAALDEVDRSTLQARERRAKEREEVAAAARRATRSAESRATHRPSGVSPRRRAARPRTGTCSCANAASSGARHRSTDSQTTATRSGAVPPRSECGDLAREELGRSARPCRFEEADRSVERRPGAGSSEKSSRSR